MHSNDMHERQVLGAIIQGNEQMPELMEILHEDMFSQSTYKAIYRTAKHLYDAGRVVSLISIISHDKKHNITLLTELSGCISSTAGLMDCAKIVAQEYIRREIVSLSSTSANRANQQDDVFDILQYMGSNASKLEQTINPSSIEHIAPIIALQSEKRAKVNGMQGIPTGFKELDEVLGGWVAECLIIVAARPAMGKTSLMLSFAYYAAQAGYAVDLYSMEMSKGQLSDNLLSMHSGIALWKIQRNKMDWQEQETLKQAEIYIAGLPIHIDDQPRLKGRQLRSRITMGVKKRNTALVMVDYIQIMGEEGKRNREQEIANISGNLKAAAKEAKIPVIALAQLSREVEKRGDRRPQLSDLRESGAVEQDADVVMFPFRAWYYHTQGVAGFEFNDKNESNENLGEILIAKHRHGMVADISIGWDGSRKLFYDNAVDKFEPKPLSKINRPNEDDFNEF
jgi:replicative DNA helicase